MACSKWEDFGLLYCSKELDSKDASEFEVHLKTCSECRTEQELYVREKGIFFTENILGETPSSKVDEEIKRVCKDARKRYTGFSFVPLILKRSAISVTFFAIGFVVVSYFIFNMDRFGSQKSIVSIQAKKTNSVQNLVTDQTLSASVQQPIDSNKDTAAYINTQGNLDLRGVLPVVDVKDK